MNILYYFLFFLISYVSILTKEIEESCYFDYSEKRYEYIDGNYTLKYYDLIHNEEIIFRPNYLDNIKYENKITRKITLYSFKNGIAKFKIDNYFKGIRDGYGFINDNGELISKSIFLDAEDFKDGLAKVNNFGIGINIDYITTSGSSIITDDFIKINDFYDGLARVSINNKYGFIDIKGKYFVYPQFDWVSDFKDGYAIFKKEEDFYFYNNVTYGIIDKYGNISLIKSLNIDEIKHFSEELILVNVLVQR